MRTGLMQLLAVVGLLATGAPAMGVTAIRLEDLTTVELKQRLVTGCPVAILYNASIEETGPHVALGKHVFRALKYRDEIAAAIGDAIVAPVMPFAPNLPPQPTLPGTIALRTQTYVAVNEDVVRSLIAGGFKRVALLADHGGGVAELGELATRLDSEYRSKGVRVFFVDDAYTKARKQIEAKIKAMGKVPGGHGGLWDTSETMAANPRAVRPLLFAPGTLSNDGNGPLDQNGVSGDPRGSSVALGRQFGAIRVRLATDQLRADLAAAGPCQ